MKESLPTNVATTVTPAPPPLPVDPKSDANTKEKGEAPMDVENDEKEPGFILILLFVSIING